MIRRWTAEEFWSDRSDVVPTGIITTNDLLRAVFLGGATEAEVQIDYPDVTVFVRGIGWRARRKMQEALIEQAPLVVNYRVKKLKGKRA